MATGTRRGRGRAVLVGALVALMAGVVLTCGPEGAPAGPTDGGADVPDAAGRPAVSIETYPRVDGSTSTLPLARVIACELLGVPYRWEPAAGEEGEAVIVPYGSTPEQQSLATSIAERIVHNRTHDAYVNLVAGRADLILVANPPSDEERAYASARAVTLELRPVALDALVVLVNSANPVTGLSAEQVRRIFMGQTTRWSDVGGGADEIHPYVRPHNSGSQQLMDAIVMQGQVMPTWPVDRTVAYMGGLIDRIKTDPLAIGYSVYYFVTYQYPGAGYRALAMDGVAPDATTIASRRYPFVAEVWAVTRSDLAGTAPARRFRDWLLTSDGQRVVGRSGYVPATR